MLKVEKVFEDDRGYYYITGQTRFYFHSPKEQRALRAVDLNSDWIVDSAIFLKNVIILILRNSAGVDALWYLGLDLHIRSNRADANLHALELDDVVDLYKIATLAQLETQLNECGDMGIRFRKALQPEERTFLIHEVGRRTIVATLDHTLLEQMEYLYGQASLETRSNLDLAPSTLSLDLVRSIFSSRDILFSALESGEMKVMDPFSQSEVTSSLSLVIDSSTQAYPFFSSAGLFFVFAFGGPHVSLRAVYFPHHNLLVRSGHRAFFNDDVGLAFPSALLDHLERYEAELSHYIKSGPKTSGRSVLLPHIGHHLWNELPALEGFLQSGRPSSNRVVYTINSEKTGHFGSPDAMFADHAFALRETSESELPISVYRDNVFFARPSSLYVTNSLSRRIGELAVRKEPETAHALAEYKTAGRTILMLCPRFDNRIWKNYESEITSVVDALIDRGVPLVILIDGHNGTGVQPEAADVAISEAETLERQFAGTMSSHYGAHVPVMSNIGGSVQRSIIFATNASLFITPWGAALAKYKWASRATGIICTNEYNLIHKRDVAIYEDDRYVEAPVKDTYFSSSEVETDFCEPFDLAGRDRANFTSHPGALREKVFAHFGW